MPLGALDEPAPADMTRQTCSGHGLQQPVAVAGCSTSRKPTIVRLTRMLAVKLDQAATLHGQMAAHECLRSCVLRADMLYTVMSHAHDVHAGCRLCKASVTRKNPSCQARAEGATHQRQQQQQHQGHWQSACICGVVGSPGHHPGGGVMVWVGAAVNLPSAQDPRHRHHQ